MPRKPTDSGQLMIELVHLYREMMRTVEQQVGMSQTRIEILHELFHAKELSQAELQQHLGVEGPVVTRIIKQLEAEGMVTRRADPSDNRFTLVSLTPEARLFNSTEEAVNFKKTFGKQLTRGLSSKELAELFRLIGQVRENIKTVSGESLYDQPSAP